MTFSERLERTLQTVPSPSSAVRRWLRVPRCLLAPLSPLEELDGASTSGAIPASPALEGRLRGRCAPGSTTVHRRPRARPRAMQRAPASTRLSPRSATADRPTREELVDCLSHEGGLYVDSTTSCHPHVGCRALRHARPRPPLDAISTAPGRPPETHTDIRRTLGGVRSTSTSCRWPRSNAGAHVHLTPPGRSARWTSDRRAPGRADAVPSVVHAMPRLGSPTHVVLLRRRASANPSARQGTGSRAAGVLPGGARPRAGCTTVVTRCSLAPPSDPPVLRPAIWRSASGACSTTASLRGRLRAGPAGRSSTTPVSHPTVDARDEPALDHLRAALRAVVECTRAGPHRPGCRALCGRRPDPLEDAPASCRLGDPERGPQPGRATIVRADRGSPVRPRARAPGASWRRPGLRSVRRGSAAVPGGSRHAATAAATHRRSSRAASFAADRLRGRLAHRRGTGERCRARRLDVASLRARSASAPSCHETRVVLDLVRL